MAKEVIVKQVDVMGLMGALRTKGKAKLSDFATPIESESSEASESTNIQNSTTMAQNVKAADLIGKVIIVGNNQGKIIVKSVQDNGMLACEFIKAGETTTTSMTVTMPNLQKMQERGLWKISDSESATVIGGVVVATEEHHDITTEADVDEVEDIAPKVTKKPAPVEQEPDPDAVGELVYEEPTAKVEPIGKPKQDKPKRKSSRKFDLEKDKPKQQPKAEKSETKGGKYVYATYKTSKGKTGAKITGFASEDDVFYANAADIHASGSYERDKQGNKLYYLCFGPRYAEAAKSICKVLNSDKTVNQKVEECKLIVSQATEERATKREEWKQKREERKAQTSAVSSQTSTEKTYTAAEVVDLIQRMAKKDPKALAEYEAMLQAA